jgi:hypothetical protein
MSHTPQKTTLLGKQTASRRPRQASALYAQGPFHGLFSVGKDAGRVESSQQCATAYTFAFHV